MSTQEIIQQKLKSYLPKGAITKVAKKHNVSVYQVSKVIAGDSENIEILSSLLDIAENSKLIKERIMAL